MSNPLEILKRLQNFMRKSKIYEEIFKAQLEEVNKRVDALDDLQKQMNIDTATWALETYEKELGLVVDPLKPLSERRSLIKAKLRGVGKVDADLIKTVVSSWTNGTVDVKFENSTIKIRFINLLGIPENMEDVKFSIEEIKPAHLAVLYQYLFNTHNILSQFTHDQLSAYTHNQLREEEVI